MSKAPRWNVTIYRPALHELGHIVSWTPHGFPVVMLSRNDAAAVAELLLRMPENEMVRIEPVYEQQVT